MAAPLSAEYTITTFAGGGPCGRNARAKRRLPAIGSRIFATKQPNYIPTDGSTLEVYIDGQPQGHPVYNIATLFPGYANSTAAVGYFNLDTTALANGVHTISWSVMDSAGSADGIGAGTSRC